MAIGRQQVFNIIICSYIEMFLDIVQVYIIVQYFVIIVLMVYFFESQVVFKFIIFSRQKAKIL